MSLHLSKRRMSMVAALLLVLTAGCGRVHQVHRIGGPFDNPKPKGIYCDLVYLSPDAAEALRGKSLLVTVDDPLQSIFRPVSRLTKQIDWKVWRENLEKYLADRLYQSRVFADVSTPADLRPIQRPQVRLRVAVTEYHEGNAFLRYFPGFGAGATRVQWEGEFTAMAEAPSAAAPRRLLAYVDARLHPGGPYLGLSLKPWDGQRLIAEDLRLAIDQLIADLRRLTNTTEKSLPAYKDHPQIGTNRELPIEATPVLPPTIEPTRKPDE